MILALGGAIPVQAAGHFGWKVDDRSGGGPLRRRRCPSFATQHSQTSKPLSPEGPVGWAADRLLPVGGELHTTHTDVDVDAHFGYGYHWFTVPEMGGYAALVLDEKIVLVIPKSELVIVPTAKTKESLFELFDKYISTAMPKEQ